MSATQHTLVTRKAAFITCLFLTLFLCFGLLPASAQTDAIPLDGDYQVGVRAPLLRDETRENRRLQTYIWYPALIPEDAKPPHLPDTSGAPYPLVFYSHGYGAAAVEAAGELQRLVSQGFVVVGIDHRDINGDKWDAFINRPLDILYVLNYLADLPADDTLAGVIDTDQVGIWGGSMGAYTAISVSGARVDPAHFQAWCPTVVDNGELRHSFDSCSLLSSWDTLLAYHEKLNVPSDDALWTATSDERIRAVLGVAPCFGQMFGESGLAETTIPVFIISGTDDSICPHTTNSVYIYEHVGSSDRYLASLQGRDHSGAFSEPNLTITYASAFFGRYLHGKTDYAQYLLPETADVFQEVTLESQLEATTDNG